MEIAVKHSASITFVQDNSTFGDFSNLIYSIEGVPSSAKISFKQSDAYSDQRDIYHEPAKLTITFTWET
jgi:hypothetical protein